MHFAKDDPTPVVNGQQKGSYVGEMRGGRTWGGLKELRGYVEGM